MFLELLKISTLLICVCLCIGAVYQVIATRLNRKKYRPQGRMVDVGGYALHMIDSSSAQAFADKQGEVTIIIDAGAGACALDWFLVQSEIAKFARVITYDRAGYGWSDASPLPRTSQNIVQELHTMLYNAGVQPPYILVGHSFGGLNIQLFAAQYPQEVAGLVLVDAVDEKVMDTIPQIFINFKNWVYHRYIASYFGIPRIIADVTHYFYSETDHDKLADQAYKQSTKYYRALWNELRLITLSCQEVQAEKNKAVLNIPVTVITAGKQVVPVQGPCGTYTDDQVAHINATWFELQDDLAHHFAQCHHMIAENSGHNIPHEQPEIIVQAVQEIIEELKK